MLAAVLERAGDHSRAEQFIRQLKSAPDPHGVPMGMIEYHLIRGDEDAAIDWFEKAVSLREPLVVVYVGDPLTEGWRTNPRWTDLMRKMNLLSAPQQRLAHEHEVI